MPVQVFLNSSLAHALTMVVQQAAGEHRLLLPVLHQQPRLVWHRLPGGDDKH